MLVGLPNAVMKLEAPIWLEAFLGLQRGYDTARLGATKFRCSKNGACGLNDPRELPRAAAAQLGTKTARLSDNNKRQKRGKQMGGIGD